MPARSQSAIVLLLFVAAACSAPGSDASPSPVGTLTASADPTRAPSSISPSPTASAGTSVNPDGSVWIRPPTLFDFAQPGDGAVWGILQYAGVGREIVRVDPETHEIETVVDGLPILPNPVAPVTHNGSIWLVSWDKSSVTQYDAQTGDLIREIAVGLNPVEPVVAYDDVWTINHNGDSVTRIDSETGEAYPPIALPGSHPLSITAVRDDLMLVQGPGPLVYVVDPEQMEVAGTYEDALCLEQRGTSRGALIDGSLWRKACDSDEIAIVDPATGEVLDSFESPAIPYPPLVVDGNRWMPFAADNGPGTFGLVGMDPDTREEVGRVEKAASIREGSSFAAFDSWWRWGWEGLLRVPADTLREAAR